MANFKNIKTFGSAITALTAGAATITVPVDAAYRHWYAHVAYYTGAAGTTEAVPTAGTETTTIRMPGSGEYYGVSSTVVDYSSANSFADWNGATDSVKLTMDSIAGASVTHCKVTVIGMIS